MRRSVRQVLFGVFSSMSLAALLVLGTAAPAEARRAARCAYVMMWTDSNGCYHERWR